MHVTVNPANNQITTAGYSYDANGNLYSGGLLSLQYDAENRVTSAVSGSSMDRYSHGPDNLRVWKLRPDGVDEVYYYDPRGQRLGTYTFFNYQLTQTAMSQASQELYFAGRKVQSQGPLYGQPLPKDRLGSIGPGFYPYGEEYATTTQNLDKFATYYRNGTTALDYANNRYYSNILGRFMTADPYRASGGPADPGSWNRYAYTRGDPVNRYDPSGLGDVPGDRGIGSNDGCGWDPTTHEYVCGCDYEGSTFLGPISGIAYFAPLPVPPPPSPLNCSFGSALKRGPLRFAMGPNGRPEQGYFIGFDFSYSASGGTGEYRWSNFQDYSVVGTIGYKSGVSNDVSQHGREEPLPYTNPPEGGRATFYDTPGLGTYSDKGSPIAAASVVFNNVLHVFVTDGAGRATECPTVSWQVWEVWRNGVPSGNAVIINVTQ